MKYIKILSVLALFFLSSCAGNMYETEGGYKRQHGYYKTDSSNQQAKAETGDKLLMVCSYYADKFHGRTTSNGETFDMYKLTCAHKKLPFNTELRVTDPDTGKSVDVRVNDRGPFIAGRDLDLSYGAAKQIGLIPFGVKKLQIEIINKP
jgi:rare lipoprotein A (peptidoglycan hydrolase)